MANKLQRIVAVALGGTLIVLGIGGALYFKNIADAKLVPAERDREQPLTLVDVYPVAPVPYVARFQARGILQGIQETLVSAEVEGRVLSKPIHEGQAVEPGTVLCRIDDTFHQYSVQAAEARLKEAEASHVNAQAELERVLELKQGHTTELEYNRYLTGRDRALALRNGAAVELEKVRELLKRCTIVSPIGGRVARVFYEQGELLTPTMPVVEIVNVDTMKLVIDLPDFEASQLEPNPRVRIRSASYPGQHFEGAVVSVYPKANPLTRRVPIEIRVDNASQLLRSGAFVECVIDGRQQVTRMLVPAQGILHEFGENYCYVARPDNGGFAVARRRVVTTPLASSVRLVEVLDGLANDDRVVLNKHQELTVGEPIVTRDVPLATAAGSPDDGEAFSGR